MMAVWAKFDRRANVKGYIPGRKKWWKRAIAKARRRFLKLDTKD
jgi:hypothetical protein